jgi:hypothetical protein
MYKGLIPQFDDFIGRLHPQDQQTLRMTYSL